MLGRLAGWWDSLAGWLSGELGQPGKLAGWLVGLGMAWNSMEYNGISHKMNSIGVPRNSMEYYGIS